MFQSSIYALLDCRGVIDWDCMYRALATIADKSINPSPGLNLPTEEEASDTHVWSMICQRLGMMGESLRPPLLSHSYSRERVFIALELPQVRQLETAAFDQLNSLVAEYAKSAGISFTQEPISHDLDLGVAIPLKGANWSLTTVPSSASGLQRLVTACLISQYIFSRSELVAINLLPPDGGIDGASLELSLDERQTLSSIYQRVGLLLDADSSAGITTDLRDRTVLECRTPIASSVRFRGEACTISLRDIVRVGPWAAKITILVDPGALPRLECRDIYLPGASLIAQVEHALTEHPDWTITEFIYMNAKQNDDSSAQLLAIDPSTEGCGEKPHNNKSAGPSDRIVVATLAFGALPYWRYSSALNAAYCARHGYGFYAIRPPDSVGRHPIWYKVKGVADVLRQADFVLFLDADAYFIDPSKSVQSLIEEHMDGADMLAGNDRRDAHYTYSDENANTGVFVVRNSSGGRAILEDWWNAPLDNDSTSLWRWPVEQAAFNAYVRNGRRADQIKIIHYASMNGRDGRYIRHLMGVSEEDRLHVLRCAHAGSESLA